MIFWTIYVSLAFYVVALVWLIIARNGNWQFARLAWTAAFGFYFAHVVAAYHFQHRWSQADALQHAAKRIDEVVGINWSGGLYVNCVFTLIWLADLVWWWVDATAYQRRPRWVTASLHFFFAFIAFNSTVVFAQGAVRWIGIGVTAVLAVLWIASRKHATPSLE